jgi:hypothetical protein
MSGITTYIAIGVIIGFIAFFFCCACFCQQNGGQWNNGWGNGWNNGGETIIVESYNNNPNGFPGGGYNQIG